MSISLLPGFKFRRVTDIEPDFLKEQGISLLLLDVDNTLIPYTTTVPDAALVKWVEMLRNADIELFVVSNNKGTRPEELCGRLGLKYIKRAGKPRAGAVLKAVKLCGGNRESTALVGDQIYTDMIAASLAGVTGILVEPIRFTNPFLAIRYFFELPFRVPTGKKRSWKRDI